MKFRIFWALVAVIFMGGMVSEPAEAKRFGKGGFGKTYKSSPFKSASPEKKQAGQDKNADAAAAGNQNNFANKAAGGRKGGMMGGLFGGLLAGGLLAYMFGSGAFEGVQFMDILLLAIIAFIAFKLLKRFMVPPQPATQGPNVYRESPEPSAVDMPNQQGAAPVQASAAQDTPMNLPEGFDVNGFLQGAIEHYHTVQKAWNEGNLETLAEYVSPAYFAQIKSEREEMSEAPVTEIIDLEAELVRADQHDGVQALSILFKGLCKDITEGSEDGIFDVWHLEKSSDQPGASWLIVGIEAQ